MDNQNELVYINPDSQIGRDIARMGIAEEIQIIKTCKTDILSGKVSNLQAVQELENFMDLWKTSTGYCRTFYLIPKCIEELNK